VACALSLIAVAAHVAGAPPANLVKLLALRDGFTSCRYSLRPRCGLKCERVLRVFAIETAFMLFETYLERVTMGVMTPPLTP
jgi:hypothetical protein